MPSPPKPCRVRGLGLLIIGHEILDGRRQDAHFATALRLLAEHRLQLLYACILPDDPGVITGQLGWAMQQPEPFFCCGGIGATPDDLTRQCAAEAAKVPLACHAEGLAILHERFGPDLSPGRRRLVEFPVGATLIPNPVNQVPGFSIANGHFMPGFPDMAAGMMQWVLATYYVPGEPRLHRALLLQGTPESEICELMEQFNARHPAVTLSSLPLATNGKRDIHLGVSGTRIDVEAAFPQLVAALDRAGIRHAPLASPRLPV
jgi:molybdopterin-biosynthesis enzyme MoeA-like protein